MFPWGRNELLCLGRVAAAGRRRGGSGIGGSEAGKETISSLDSLAQMVSSSFGNISQKKNQFCFLYQSWWSRLGENLELSQKDAFNKTNPYRAHILTEFEFLWISLNIEKS